MSLNEKVLSAQTLPPGLISNPTWTLIEQVTRENNSFSKTAPGFQYAIDSTSLGDFKRCPRYYFYSIICGLRGGAESPHLTFGLYMHGASERYQHSRALGVDHEEALSLTLAWVMEATWDRELNRPWSSDHRTKNRKSLIQTVVWYLDHFKDDSIKTVILANGKPAVELSFRFDSGYRFHGENVMFCGHLDRLGTLNDSPVIPDIKTTEQSMDDRWFDKWTPGNQFSMYALAGRVVWNFPVHNIIVDGIQVGAGFARFHRRLVPRGDRQVEEWHQDSGEWIESMARCAEKAKWPQNDKACDLFGGCQFRELCSRSPLAREQWARLTYKRRVWDPLEVRGDI